MRFLALLTVLLTIALAFPRLGLHEGYTRMVFDLGPGTTYQVAQGDGTLTLKFQGIRPAADDADVDSPQVASYQVVSGKNGATVYIRLKPQVKVKTSLMQDGNGRRLVVDLLSSDKPQITPTSSKPTPSPKPRVQTDPDKKRIVVLDPGHGGIDSGAVGYVTEKAITLDVALRVRKLLQDQGIQVVMTRTTDTQLSTDKRTDLGLRADMANSKRTLFVAIHVNSSPGNSAQGIETYYFGDTMDSSLLAQVYRENGGGTLGQQLTREAQTVGQRLVSDLLAQANLVYSRRLAETLQNSMLSATGAVNRGIHSAPFYVIRNARIPAVLIEIGFANHPVEGRKLGTPSYRDTVAQSIADGILRFINNGASVSR
ncbi:N-acetylmuramoyl-L-alanine amidase family protein [Meiothermus granaticius]|uniref:N-acetylmuramoyl-L-alanine amidase AmiA n=1 Tax=Meiothermus granaticius NBRC 107808 TaxID=1227551 RepID=A0A399F7L0_9DEIN|nr:N-acetylmuramoyl-L-alanine amidase [Meiothermus granaticius]RIH91239.1 N-acetylmuramoyl-L-alanine amidase AmiA [Meiothermus granaticius NBRC 107808]GEM86530.1 N-acetylmuramoyl-L-alanine amidase [Meiothermus granaticius NBRC 107808]